MFELIGYLFLRMIGMGWLWNFKYTKNPTLADASEMSSSELIESKVDLLSIGLMVVISPVLLVCGVTLVWELGYSLGWLPAPPKNGFQ
jgi:hypothetical protein